MANHRKPADEKAEQISISLYKWQIEGLKAKYPDNLSYGVREGVTMILRDDEEAKRQELAKYLKKVEALEAELEVYDEIRAAEAERYQKLATAAEPIRQSIEYQTAIKRDGDYLKLTYEADGKEWYDKQKPIVIQFHAKKFNIPEEIVREDIETGVNIDGG